MQKPAAARKNLLSLAKQRRNLGWVLSKACRGNFLVEDRMPFTSFMGIVQVLIFFFWHYYRCLQKVVVSEQEGKTMVLYHLIHCLLLVYIKKHLCYFSFSMSIFQFISLDDEHIDLWHSVALIYRWVSHTAFVLVV